MSEVKIVAKENGSVRVHARARYVDADGQERVTEGQGFSLCRCGGSANKPFCDGTHRKIGFQAPALELTLIVEE